MFVIDSDDAHNEPLCSVVEKHGGNFHPPEV